MVIFYRRGRGGFSDESGSYRSFTRAEPFFLALFTKASEASRSRDSQSENSRVLLIWEVSISSFYFLLAFSLAVLFNSSLSYVPFRSSFCCSLPLAWEEVAALFVDPLGPERWSSLSCYPFLIGSRIINFFFSFLNTQTCSNDKSAVCTDQAVTARAEKAELLVNCGKVFAT